MKLFMGIPQERINLFEVGKTYILSEILEKCATESVTWEDMYSQAISNYLEDVIFTSSSFDNLIIEIEVDECEENSYVLDDLARLYINAISYTFEEMKVLKIYNYEELMSIIIQNLNQKDTTKKDTTKELVYNVSERVLGTSIQLNNEIKNLNPNYYTSKECCNQKHDVHFLLQNRDEIDWESLHYNVHLTEEVICRTIEYLDLSKLRTYPKDLSILFIFNYSNVLNWTTLTKSRYLDYDFVSKCKDKLDTTVFFNDKQHCFFTISEEEIRNLLMFDILSQEQIKSLVNSFKYAYSDEFIKEIREKYLKK